MSEPVNKHDTMTNQYRAAAYPISPIFLRRWSPRAFEATAMPLADLYTILEASRWAPSAYNHQPWRFIYATRGDAYWSSFLDLLDPFNEKWARNASVLVFVVSDRVTPAQESSLSRLSQTHSFDAGAAWAHLALQATELGYQAHAMAGIHFDHARRQLTVPHSYHVEIAVAIGKQSDPSSLPPPLREREIPSSRLPLEMIAFAGRFAPEQTKDSLGSTDKAEEISL